MLKRLLLRTVVAHEDEAAPLAWATAYGFCILFSYYILRAVRDEISAADRGNLQYLWTAARENLNIVTVVFSNRSYSILDTEYRRLGVNSVGDTAASLFNLGNPDINWVALANGYGVPAAKADTAQAFVAALETGMRTAGPYLIEAEVVGR